MKLVVDAGVFVAEQIERQPEFTDAVNLLERCVRQNIHLYAPAIVFSEVAGAVARITGSTALGAAAVARLNHIPRLKFRQIDLDFAETSARLAARHKLRGADSLYAALARELKCPLVTNDAELLNRSPGGWHVIKPVDWLKSHPA